MIRGALFNRYLRKLKVGPGSDKFNPRASIAVPDCIIDICQDDQICGFAPDFPFPSTPSQRRILPHSYSHAGCQPDKQRGVDT